MSGLGSASLAIRAGRVALAGWAALLPGIAPAAAPPPEHIGGWTLRADPAMPGAGCSMALRDGGGTLLVMLAGGDLRVEASAKAWFASGAIDYPVHLTVDGDPIIDIAAQGAGPDGLHLLPNAKVPTAGFVSRLGTARSLAIRKEGNPLVETVTFGVADFRAALVRLEACAAGAEERNAALAGDRRARCITLADAAAMAVGGTREASESEDRIPLVLPGARALVSCETGTEGPSIALWRDEPGVPAAMLGAAARLAGVLTGRPAAAFAGTAAACLKRVVSFTHRHGGKRSSFPDGTTTYFEGEARAPSLKLSCHYYDHTMVQPSITLERS